MKAELPLLAHEPILASYLLGRAKYRLHNKPYIIYKIINELNFASKAKIWCGVVKDGDVVEFKI